MRRAECIEWPPCPHPNQVAVRNKYDYSHRKPYISYQARSQIIMSEGHDVLNIDIFEGFRLVARYFADVTTGSHAALIMDTGEWKKCILQNVVNVCAGLSPLSQNYGTYSCFQSEQFAWASGKGEPLLLQSCVLGKHAAEQKTRETAAEQTGEDQSDARLAHTAGTGRLLPVAA